ncbi:hypothetical protein [Photorhabdus luminescens]|uniref:hypothetical protein n=1 Tax=Photorhabdus luminescens TaxID=29488 RepID=UPI0026A52605
MKKESINTPDPDNTESSVANKVEISNEISWTALPGVISAANNADGRLEIFGVSTDNAVWHNWQTVPNTESSWSGWRSMNEGATSKPAVYINSDGRLEVFVRGSDNALWHNWQTAPGAVGQAGNL